MVVTDGARTEPAALRIKTRYEPAEAAVALLRTSSWEVAPGRVRPLNCHWNSSGAVPETPTGIRIVSPAATVTSDGWVMIEGGTITVRTAAGLLVMDPAALLTRTE